MPRKTPPATTPTTEEPLPRESFPVPFTRAQMLEELESVLFDFARMTLFIANPTVTWSMLGKPERARQGRDAAYQPADMLLTREDLGFPSGSFRDWSVYGLMEDLYDLAFHGRAVRPITSFDRQGDHSWAVYFILDLCRLSMGVELESYGSFGTHSSRCRHVVLLANARVTLETGESLAWLHEADRDQTVDAGMLTIRQLALLAGIEETTVRSLISRGKGTDAALRTVKGDGNATLVPVAEAKAWLQARGRYVPVTYRPRGGDADLARTRFKGAFDLYEFIDARRLHLGLSAQALDARVQAAWRRQRDAATDGQAPPPSLLDARGRLVYDERDAPFEIQVHDCLGLEREENLPDERLCRALGTALEVDAELMALRVRETALQMRLAATSHAIAKRTATDRPA